MATVINRARIKQYLELNLNVLFIGLHGTGKTTVIKSVFDERFGDKWKYFSASTLDPWVDFVGVPKPRTDKNGVEVLDLIRPKFIQYDEVEAIIFDEFNRAPDKVINAVMELIQFKSINGHRLNNLKVIWAAINPEDDNDTYSVNHLDPAQLDRFQVHYQVPYRVDTDYFYGKHKIYGEIFVNWWNSLPGDIQKKVSPRRLDYAADAYSNNLRLEDFLPFESNVKKLRDALKSISFHDKIKAVTSQADAELFIRDINNSTTLLDMIKLDDKIAIDFFIKYGEKLPKELVEPFANYVISQKYKADKITSYEELIDKLPTDQGYKPALIINGVNLKNLVQSNLEDDIRQLAKSKPQLVAKLANRCIDSIIKTDDPKLLKLIWVDELGGVTNFQRIVGCFLAIGGYITKNQETFIKKRLLKIDWTNYVTTT